MSFFNRNHEPKDKGPNPREDQDQDQARKGRVNTITGHVASDTARQAEQQAAMKFAKPNHYTGNRRLFDDGGAKRNAKVNKFATQAEVIDPYTGQRLMLTKKEAKALYADKWADHLAESDHIVPIEKGYGMICNNPWVTTEDSKAAFNGPQNISVTSRKYNNAKRSRTNKQLVENPDYLAEKGIKLTREGKEAALQDGKAAEREIRGQLRSSSIKNAAETFHTAGLSGAQSAGTTVAVLSGIENFVDYISGRKDFGEAAADTAKDTGRAAANAYLASGGMTTITHALSSSKSEFVKALVSSGVPDTVITAVTATGDILVRYFNNEITTQECLFELGDRGLNYATMGYSVAVGQAVIPIPVIGGAIGALVGSALTSGYYRNLIRKLQERELEHQERMRIISECNRAATEANAFRIELERYLEEYFQDYRDCFDTAISAMQFSFQMGDADGVIGAANQITMKLGGQVPYNDTEEFKKYFDSIPKDFI